MTARDEKRERDHERCSVEAEQVFDSEITHESELSVSALMITGKATFVLIVSLLVCGVARADTARSAARWYGPRLQNVPQRIVSLAPSTTEILFALGAGPSVIAVTRYCDFPPEAASRTKVGGVLDLNVEGLVALHPDLVVGIEAKAAEPTYERLGELGITTLEVPSDRLEDFQSTVSAIAVATHRDSAPLIQTFTQAMASLPKAKDVRTLVIVESRPLFAAGETSFVAKALTHIGLTSVARGALFPELNRETIAAMPLDLVLDLANPPAELVTRAPILRIHDERLLRLSPRLPQALRSLYEQLPRPR